MTKLKSKPYLSILKDELLETTHRISFLKENKEQMEVYLDSLYQRVTDLQNRIKKQKVRRVKTGHN